MSELRVFDLPTRILAALSERLHRIRDGSQSDPWVPYLYDGVLYEVHALNLDVRKAGSPSTKGP